MAKRYRITLTDDERERLRDLTRKGMASARMVRRAQTLLLAANALRLRHRRSEKSEAAAQPVFHRGLQRVSLALRRLRKDPACLLKNPQRLASSHRLRGQMALRGSILASETRSSSDPKPSLGPESTCSTASFFGQA
jgi:hypothetical protein